MNDTPTNIPQKEDAFSTKMAEKALDFIREQAPHAAIAKANRVYMEEFRKTVKANCMASSDEKALAAQERDAYAHADYQAHLKVMQSAIEEDELYRWKMVAAQATIEAWRTHQANIRREQALG